MTSEALLAGALSFPRSTRMNATGERFRVVGFGDGALPGFGANVYLQWHVECEHDDQFGTVGVLVTIMPTCA